MIAAKLGPIYQLSEREISDVIDDVERAAEGVSILYCVDSHEVIDFCFPIHLDDPRQVVIDRIADDQAALYEVFYARSRRPILIPEYGKELERHLGYLQMRADEIHDLAAEINALAGGEGLDDLSGSSTEQMLEKMEKQFNNLLAVVIGIHSSGIERLQSIAETRLERLDEIGETEIRNAAQSYTPSALAKEIFDDLMREKPSWTPSEVYRKTLAAETDALAVDWLLQLNRGLRHDGQLRYRVLYLSSATRTRRIFGLPAVRNFVDKFLQTKCTLYRSRAQILARLVSTEPEASPASTIEKLQQIQSIVTSLKSIRDLRPGGCDSCVLDGLPPKTCEDLEVCRSVQHLEVRRQSIQNMGLLGRIQRYQHLLESKSKDSSHREYIQSFRKLLETENLKDLAIARMKANLGVRDIRDQLKTMTGAAQPDERDVVRSPSYFLPVEPTVNEPAYRKIVSQIFESAELEIGDPKAAKKLMQTALRDFDELDRNNANTSAEHELVRCVIYMTDREKRLEVIRGDANAFEYAKKMAETDTDLKAEFLYIVVWTARRIGNVVASLKYANQAVGLFPDDARFYHGRSVTILCWLEDEQTRAVCPRTFADALSDAKRALELYGAETANRTSAMARQLNNIAWIHVSAGKKSEVYSLVEARKALTQLVALFPRDQWLPDFASFLHTEAYIEFEEYKQEFRASKSLSEKRIKLEYASECLREIQTKETPAYAKLQGEIKAELAILSKEEKRAQTRLPMNLDTKS